VPSGRIVTISAWSVRLVNASSEPSGDHAGSPSHAGELVTSASPEPSAVTTMTSASPIPIECGSAPPR
jgi:hypothetical protein